MKRSDPDILNPHATGIRTMIVCSCGHQPAAPPQSMRTMHNSHDAHRRSLGLPRSDIQPVFGDGPWTGLTWNEWYETHGGTGADPHTGNTDRA